MSNDNILPEIKNWKLREVINDVEVLSKDSVAYKENIISNLRLPPFSKFTGSTLTITDIEWSKMFHHYKFFLDDKEESLIEKAFRNSELSLYNKIILIYNSDNLVVKIPIELFFKDWEGFTRSQLWEGLIFSDDFKLIMETSRDYYFHSNFKIWHK